MFTFANSGVVWWPVSISVADVETGQIKEASFLAQLKIRTRSERKALEKSYRDNLLARAKTVKTAEEIQQLALELEKREDEEEIDLTKRIKDWDKKLVDTNGEPIPFNAKNLKAMLDIDPLYQAFKTALTEASKGARAKN
jgi:hypothetical protein